MSNYKAIVSDIDGTLLNDRHQISEKTRNTIKKITQLNIPFILISARPPLAITPFIYQLKLNTPLVCFGGALILDSDLNPLYSVEIANNDFQELEYALQNFNHLSINYYVNTHWFSNNSNNSWTIQEEQIIHLKSNQKPNNLTNVHKILIIGNAEEIKALEAKLKNKFPHLSIYRSKTTYLEIMNKKATKSNAIRFLETIFNVTQKEIIAFGDNFNDLDMLEYVGLGVAMNNAPDEIKAKANRIALSNNQDGLAIILDELFCTNSIKT